MDKASQWYDNLPWLVGCNFIPSSAINQLEMWQAGTFDPGRIDRELGWAADIGFNTIRVYLHDLAWEVDAEGFKGRIDQFLGIAAQKGIKPLFVFFDDCWNPSPKIGPQPEPVPSVHNSGWLQSPGIDIVNNLESWERLERYVVDITSRFAQDERVLMWDLYNEPGNNGNGEKSLPLVKKVFEWARYVNPSQPLSIGVWADFPELNEYQLTASDVITFHNYEPADHLSQQITRLRQYGRPLICTEWMARTRGSLVETNLPIFQLENVGCINWGLVTGKTNTIWPWDTEEGAPEPDLWFHDLLRSDGTPYSDAEIPLFKKLTRDQNHKPATKR
jgi:endo-1,4-beta-mannosidase